MWFIAALVVAALISVLVGVSVFASSNTEKLSDYATAHNKLSKRYEAAKEITQEAEDLEPALQSELEDSLSQTMHVLDADAPGSLSFNIAGRIVEVEDAYESLAGPADKLEMAIVHRSDYAKVSSTGQEMITEAESVLKDTKDKVLDTDSYSDLKEHIGELKSLLEEKPAAESGQEHSGSTKTLRKLIDAVKISSEAVVGSHEEWEEAEEEAAKQDPANYKSLSARDWQLVERDPDSYKGEKYVLYGAVTQADAATGDINIRVDTGATRQSRRYNYDVNTMALAGSSGVFDSVVRGDHVKMFVEIGGAMTYDTTIGGSATAVMVLANNVEVIGQF